MRNVLGMVLVLGAVFWAGYYVGQQPPGALKRQLQTMSDQLTERAHDLRDLSLQQEFLDAKARFLDGKAEILEGKYEKAVTELEETLHHLNAAIKMQGKETSHALLDAATSKIAALQRSLADGQDVSREAMDDAQEDLDSLLGK